MVTVVIRVLVERQTCLEARCCSAQMNWHWIVNINHYWKYGLLLDQLKGPWQKGDQDICGSCGALSKYAQATVGLASPLLQG